MSLRWIRDTFTLNDNLGVRFDWRTFLFVATYAALVDLMCWMAGGPIGGIALLVAIWWYTR